MRTKRAKGLGAGLNLLNVGSTANPFVHISIFGVNGLLEKIRCADQVSMSWILHGLLLEEQEAFDFSDSLQ
jgi:hypothetical protein